MGSCARTVPKRKSRFSEPGQEALVSAHGHGPIFEGDDFGCVGPGPQENDPPKSDILYYHYNNDINTIIIIRNTIVARDNRVSFLLQTVEMIIVTTTRFSLRVGTGFGYFSAR